MIMDLHRIATRRFVLPAESPHGMSHWHEVLRNGRAIWGYTREADIEVIEAFAILHDMERLNEASDIDHGHRAATVISYMDELPLIADKMPKLYEAIRRHADGDTTTDPTIGACWDADRLDLIRFGIQPDPAYLSTERGKYLAEQIFLRSVA